MLYTGRNSGDTLGLSLEVADDGIIALEARTIKIMVDCCVFLGVHHGEAAMSRERAEV